MSTFATSISTMSDHPLLKPSTNVLANDEYKHSKYSLRYLAYDVHPNDIMPINDYEKPVSFQIDRTGSAIAGTGSAIAGTGSAIAGTGSALADPRPNNYTGFCFSPPNRFDALRLIPDTAKGRELLDPDWKLILLMKKTVSDSEIWLKGAFRHRETGRLALLTSTNGSENLTRIGLRAMNSHDHQWSVGHFGMSAPWEFWKELAYRSGEEDENEFIRGLITPAMITPSYPPPLRLFVEHTDV